MPRCAEWILAWVMVLLPVAATATEDREPPLPSGGTIRGVVRVVGEVTPLPPQPVYKNAEVCGATVPDDRLLVGQNGVLANVVLSLPEIPPAQAMPTEPITIDNAHCAFVPHVVAARVGQTIAFHNSDPFLHDAHALLGVRTLFNVAIPKGRTVTRTLSETGLVHVNCNVRHTWMHAYVYVSPNSYHAVSDANGSFQISQIPPGRHRLVGWHELLGSREQTITVEPGKTSAVAMEFAVAPTE